MNAYDSLKHRLKLGRWRMRRAAAALRWGPAEFNKMPAVFGNAMAKSGSHLIIQVLQGLTRLGPFVDPGFPPANRGEDNRKLPDKAVLANIRRMRPGDIGYGYVAAREPFLSALTEPGRATVFVYRDPRDMLVSHIFFAGEMNEAHAMNAYYNQVAKTTEERLNTAIRGLAGHGADLPSVRARYESYLGWLAQPNVLCLRFEDLILDREAAFNRLLDFLAAREFAPNSSRSGAVDILKQAIEPKKSGTFRKGRPGEWREHFTAANKALFKELAGDILIKLNYEKDNNW
jgi:hypothetical protein